MAEPSPWEHIAVPTVDYNVRQVTADTAVPCFWGRNREGACLFIIELQGDHTAQYRKSVVPVFGIDVDLRGSDAGRQHLVLTLHAEVDRDLFAGLCRTLASALDHAGDSASSLAIALAHIRRWKTFMSGRGQRLTEGEIRGLFAELAFLLELLDESRPASEVVEGWLGPDRSHQDFVFGNTAVEIKALSGTERSEVRVSSEDQLESLNDGLFLRVYRLSHLPDSAGALSLNAAVMEVQARIQESEALEIFDRKLVSYGYVPLPEYDKPLLVISGVRTYRVGAAFPRLVRSQLPAGVTKVSYEIKLEALESFACENRAVFGES